MSDGASLICSSLLCAVIGVEIVARWSNQVSLRGASAREITRDALLEKVSQEREARSYARRANAAALFIQVRCSFWVLTFCTVTLKYGAEMHLFEFLMLWC